MFFPARQVIFCRELGMCELQVPLLLKLISPRTSADRNYSTPSLGKCLLRPRQTILNYFNLTVKLSSS